MNDAPEAPGAPEAQLPDYVIENARSGRSRCKTCRRTIDKDTLRIGFLIEGPYGTGYLWNHLRCSARKNIDRVEEAYAAEAWNNAKVPPSSVPPLDELRKLREVADRKKKERKIIPYVELAPTGRSKCKHCGEPIEKGSLRVVLGRGVEFGNQVRTAPTNVHPKCVKAELDNPESTTEAEGLSQALGDNSRDIADADLATAIEGIGPLS